MSVTSLVIAELRASSEPLTIAEIVERMYANGYAHRYGACYAAHLVGNALRQRAKLFERAGVRERANLWRLK